MMYLYNIVLCKDYFSPVYLYIVDCFVVFFIKTVMYRKIHYYVIYHQTYKTYTRSNSLLHTSAFQDTEVYVVLPSELFE